MSSAPAPVTADEAAAAEEIARRLSRPQFREWLRVAEDMLDRVRADRSMPVAPAHSEIAEAVDASSVVATIQDLANLQFSDEGPELEGAIGDRRHWVELTADHYATIRLAVATLRKSDIENHAVVVAAGEACATEFIEAVARIKNYYAAVAELLGASQIRIMASLARQAVAAGPAA